MYWDSYILIAISTLFTIVNPIGAVGPFLAMTTSNHEDEERLHSGRAHVARQATFVSALVLCACAALGSFAFKFFGITLPALKIAGGFLLFLIAVDMLSARTSRMKATKEEHDEGVQKEDVAIFPIAIPLLAGPGAIGSVFMLMDKAQNIARQVSVFAAIIIVMFASYIILIQAHRIAKILGRIGMNVMNRLMGLILAALATQFILEGIIAALPGLNPSH